MGVSQRTRYLLPLGFFLTALTIRVVLFGLSGEMCLDSGDTPSYITIARSLAGGQGYTLDGRNPIATRMPLYPVFLAGVFSIPNAGTQAAVFFQLVMGSLSVMMGFLLARRLLPPGQALLSRYFFDGLSPHGLHGYADSFGNRFHVFSACIIHFSRPYPAGAYSLLQFPG